MLPRGRAALARWVGLCVALAGLALAVVGFAAGMGQGRVVIVDVPWVPSMGIHYLLAADGISRVLVLLTGIAAVAGVLFSWNIDLRTNEFFAFYLALIGGVYGVFLSFDRIFAVRLLRGRDCAQVLSDLHLGLDASRVRSDEASALLVRGLVDGADRSAGGLRDSGQPLDQPDCAGDMRDCR